MTVLIGADPELFAFKGNKPISVHNLLTGDKKNPLPVEEGAVQVLLTQKKYSLSVLPRYVTTFNLLSRR